MAHCDLSDPDNIWNFCASVPASYLFAILFGLLVVAHIVQAAVYRKWYSIVLIISAMIQTAVFIVRILSIQTPTSIGLYSIWFVLILVAPLWTNAYVYMVMGRMVYNFLPNHKLFRTPAWRFGLYFVLLDIVAFFIQVAGASMASGNDISMSQINNGLHIYMGGVGFQQLFILLFVGMAIRFQRRVVRESPIEQQIRGLRLLYILYAVLFLITVRIIFRLIEWSNGIDSSIPNHEVYMYVFDTAPMWIAILLFNIIHPGRLMPGKESDMPSRKERKRARKEKPAGGSQFEMLDSTEHGVAYNRTNF